MYPVTIEDVQSKENATDMMTLSSYTQHDPIDIRNDTALAFYAVSGTGDPGTPYVLEGWNITAEAGNTRGILIWSTTKHFVIRDCWLSGGGFSSCTGIEINSAATGTAVVERIHCESLSKGILVSYASDAIVKDCSIQRCIDAVLIDHADNSTVFNNTAFENDEYGMRIIAGATIVANNRLWANGHGIGLFYAYNALIENNTLIDDGFYADMTTIAAYETISEKNNTVNGLPLAFLISEEGAIYDGGIGQAILINCTKIRLSDLNLSHSENGVFMLWCTDCEIRDSHLDHNDDRGLFAAYSDDIDMENVTASLNGADGCYFPFCTNLTLFNLTLTQNLYSGFLIQTSNSVNITDCNIIENGRGIKLEGAGTASIQNNRFVNSSYYGLEIMFSWNMTVTDNDFTDDGIMCQAWSMEAYFKYSDNITGNMVNGKPLTFYNSLQDITITSPHGQIFLTNCSNVVLAFLDCSHTVIGINIAFSNGCSIIDSDCSFAKQVAVNVMHSNFTLVQNTVCDHSWSSGISVGNSASTSLVENHCSDNSYGIIFSNSQDGELMGNMVTGNRYYGLLLSSARDTLVYNNTCDFNLAYGMYVDTSVELSIFNNAFNSNSAYGIYIFESSEIIVHSNECRLNAYFGIYVEYSSCTITANRVVENGQDGLYIIMSGPYLVNWNTITANDGYGIRMVLVSDSILMHNTVALNDDYGACLLSCANISVHHNSFVSNNDGGLQACDITSSTILWYDPDTVEGNYWSDWSGAGPYFIDSDAGNYDLYPLGEIDSDSDTLPDSWEIANGLNPFSPDSDSDSLPDVWEVMYELNPLANDTAGDLDDDGLSNLEEYILGLNPASDDSDGDLMPDHWEVQNYLNPLYNDAGFDPDSDDISNLYEYLGETNPHVYDGPSTTTTTTTGTTTTQASWDILPLFLAAVGGFSAAIVLALLIWMKAGPKKAS